MFTYHDATITSAGEALRAKEITVSQMLCQARQRIAALDQCGEKLNAVLELNPQAEGIAISLDAQYEADVDLAPLHGIPVLLKDNIDTNDMMHTSAGSLALKGRYAPADAFIVKKLRDAGALLLGKANMTEFANYIAQDMPNGYSSRGGQVKHPWGDFDPSGSSTGSAVAVAAGYVPYAIGTETLGSIISPACEAGIAAVKPTVGLVSRSGILPISISQDTAGPMARCIKDCAIVLDVIAGPDPSDPYTLHGKNTTGYANAVDDAPQSLKGITIGLFNKDYDGNPVTNDAFLGALEVLKSLGAQITQVTLPKPEHESGIVMSNEFRACMDYALQASMGCPTTLAEIAAYNIRHAESCLKYGQRTFESALHPDKGLNNPDYIKARQTIYEKMNRGIEQVFSDHHLSAVITPCCSFFPVAGFPSVTLPVGIHEGRPVPLVLNGCAFSEHTLLQIAKLLEDAVGYTAQPPLTLA